MLVLVVGAAALLGLAAIGYPSPVQQPAPVTATAQLPIPADAFLQTLAKPKSEKEEPSQKESVGPSLLVADSQEANLRAQADRLWVPVSKYQAACGIAARLTQAEFVESLRQTPLKAILEARGSQYATDQEKFVANALGSNQMIAACRSGRTGLFFEALEFHRSSWDAEVDRVLAADTKERLRVAAFEEAERRRVEAGKAGSLQLAWSAAIAFGAFMSVALVLIFARLEANLRDVKVIERSSREAD